MSIATANGAPALRGRDLELSALDALLQRARSGHSATLVVAGDAGIGKSALVDHAASKASTGARLVRIVASESEMELAYAGLQLLCSQLMDTIDRLPDPQRHALESAFGLRATTAPSPLLVGLAVLGLLTEAADDEVLMCVIDDAQWLDQASAHAIAFAARRLDADRIALILVMRAVRDPFADLPRLNLAGLGDDDAKEILRGALPGPLDPRVRDQIIVESGGNPLALQELPRSLTPEQIAGGYTLSSSLPLEGRIEQSLLGQLSPLAPETRQLLLLASADSTGDPALLRRACHLVGVSPEHFDIAESAGALVVGTRVGFRHPLVRSAVYRDATPGDRRRAHYALAEATDPDHDPDRRAWHRANATMLPDEAVATELDRSAERARARGGPAAVAAFLERAAELSPDDDARVDRLIGAAEARFDAGAFESSLRLLDTATGASLTALQTARMELLRARAGYALRRDSTGVHRLLAAAQALDPVDPILARDAYIEALAAASWGGRLGDPEATTRVARTIVDATAHDRSEEPRDLLLRGQALLVAEGQQAAVPTLRRALRALVERPADALEVNWMWWASRAAQDMWDADGMRILADRQVELARSGGVLSVLPIALSLQMVTHVLSGDVAAAVAACDEIDALQGLTSHSVPPYGRLFLAAYRGQAPATESLACEIRSGGYERGEGYALSAANFAEAILYNGLGRYDEALEPARRELPYAHELNHAMRTLLELVEAAVRTGERDLAEEAFEKLSAVTTPLGNDHALGARSMAEAQLREGDDAEALFLDAISRFERERIPILVGRTQLLYGEALRRQNRRVDARAQLRSAHEIMSIRGLTGFADRAARELRATGETVRVRSVETMDQLTEQELNVARLARKGLTNREIGGRLFISARTAEYHLRKVFTKLGITSRSELRTALTDAV